MTFASFQPDTRTVEVVDGGDALALFVPEGRLQLPPPRTFLFQRSPQYRTSPAVFVAAGVVKLLVDGVLVAVSQYWW